MRVQERAGFFLADTHADSHEIVRRHQVADALLRVVGKSHIAPGHDADEFSVRFDDRDAGYVVTFGEGAKLSARGVRADGDRVHDHAGLVTLDLADFLGLLVDGQVAVDDTDTADLRHGDGERGFGHRVHGRADEWHVHRDATRQARVKLGLRGDDVGRLGLQEDVIEGQTFPNLHGESPFLLRCAPNRGTQPAQTAIPYSLRAPVNPLATR